MNPATPAANEKKDGNNVSSDTTQHVVSKDTEEVGLNWLKIRALVALYSFKLGPPHIDGWASGGSSEEIIPKTCTRSAHRVI